MNKYEILDRIGEGEYGVVLKGRNKESGQLVAIKKFKQDDTDQQNKRVILREVKILKMLKSDYVIELKEAFRKKGRIYLVCEYVEKNLLEILDEGPVSSQQARHYVYLMLKGIAYMHSVNVIHRDIKPQNVLVSKQGAVKICDLGFARTIPSNRVMTDYVATRWYRPPELLIGREDYDCSIDIWSVGCVMAELIDGNPLFPGQNDLDQLYLIQKCLGPLIATHQEHFLKNPKFIGMKFPEIHNIDSIQRKYFGKIDKQGLDLLKRMLKMDPKQRISAQDALNHPYFQRNGNLSESQIRRGKIQLHDDRRNDDNASQISQNNNFFANQKSAIPPNNFLQQKTHSKQEKVGTNKVTGLIKLKKAPPNEGISSIRQPNIARDQQGNKGKSLGSKKIGLIKDGKYGPLTDKKTRNNLKSRAQAAKIIPDAQLDQYYEQKWEDQATQQPIQNFKKQKIRQKQFLDSPVKKQELRKSKILSKNFKKDNYNIIFNNNTYNLNMVEPFN